MVGGIPIRGDGWTLEFRSACKKRQILRRSGWRGAVTAACLAVSLLVGPSANADDFDPLVVYEEASDLNDQWQACAASFIKREIRTHQTEEWLAEQALDRCRARQNDLGEFLTERVEEKSASNVMALLREKYRSGLIAAITELRARNQGASLR